jgi:hypothetical protein
MSRNADVGYFADEWDRDIEDGHPVEPEPLEEQFARMQRDMAFIRIEREIGLTAEYIRECRVMRSEVPDPFEVVEIEEKRRAA